MKRGNNPLVLCLFGILPVVWLGLLIAPAAGGDCPKSLPVSCGNERPLQNRALRGQSENCPRFALRVRACYRRISFLPPQLPQG